MKKLLTVLIAITLLSFLIHSCKKEDDDNPSPNTSTPEYYANWEVDGINHTNKDYGEYSDNYIGWQSTRLQSFIGGTADTLNVNFEIDFWSTESFENLDIEKELLNKNIPVVFGSGQGVSLEILLYVTDQSGIMDIVERYSTSKDSSNIFFVTEVVFFDTKKRRSVYGYMEEFDIYNIRGNYDLICINKSHQSTRVKGEFFMEFTHVKD